MWARARSGGGYRDDHLLSPGQGDWRIPVFHREHRGGADADQGQELNDFTNVTKQLTTVCLDTDMSGNL